MRTSALLLALAVALVAACTDPAPPPRATVQTATVVAAAPEGTIDRSARFSFALSSSIILDSAQIVLVSGGADATDVAALAKGRPNAALRARSVPLSVWGEPRDEPTTLFAQPTAALSPGPATIVVLLDHAPPFTADVTVSDAPLAARVWPLGNDAANVFTWCATDALAELPAHVELAPAHATARVVARDGLPCFDLVPDAALEGPAVPPDRLGGVALDPAPLVGGVAVRADEPCPSDAIAIASSCVRIDDDRLTFVGGMEAARLVLGRVGDRAVIAPLAPGARVVVRGLVPAKAFDVDLWVRDGDGETRVQTTWTMAHAHRHVIVNEVLARAPSGSSAQRFVELVNDGDRAAFLGGLDLVDGDARLPLPEVWLAPGAYALVVPDGFLDGLAGDEAPPSDVPKLVVPALHLSGTIAVAAGDFVLSRFPASTSTRAVSRGRRAPDRPDDAPDAFGWDANGRATPGRPNRLAPR